MRGTRRAVKSRWTAIVAAIMAVGCVVEGGREVIIHTGRRGADSYQSAAARTVTAVREHSARDFEEIELDHDQEDDPGFIHQIIKSEPVGSKVSTSGYGLSDLNAGYAGGNLVIRQPDGNKVTYWMSVTQTTGTLLGRGDGWFVALAPAPS